tara:strand:- start:8 stop:1111 length:1104 start_codon:yes stop_codon:yes gene_type:complete
VINVNNKKVIIALSGGVDSAVSMLLLKEKGAIVEALHMTNWDDDDQYCSAAEDLQDAKKLCKQLSVPLHHVNFTKEYRENVFENFLNEYKKGRTPNPDILCNREIKFGVFKNHAERLGGEFIATGHYAKIENDNGATKLFKSKDKNKDQTYFLYAVEPNNFKNTIFPLADIPKEEVRAIAQANGLINYKKRDSTGICFIGKRPFKEFLGSYIPSEPGNIIDKDGTIVGEHDGLMFHTIGQRQGLNIGGIKNGSGEPWYVSEKDIKNNTLIVVQGDHHSLYSKGIVIIDESWIKSSPITKNNPNDHLECKVKVRYRQADQGCKLYLTEDEKITVLFNEPQRSVALGQSAVFYMGEECLGGGIIDEIIK